MTSRLVYPLNKQGLPRAFVAIAGLAAMIAAEDRASATSGRSERAIQFVESRVASEPLLAIVSLRDQRITVYDAKGWVMRAPVSTGQRGRETPAGIFSVIQKEAEHYSNLYDDAYMPHMQRITWSGIALHGGLLPGYPASHGCIRLPFEFAARLFDATRLGMRVIVAPSDVAPVQIAHPLLFAPNPTAVAFAAARAAEAAEAARKADEARIAAIKASREAARAMMPVRVAENLKRRAEFELVAADAALGSAISTEAKEQAEEVKARALARITQLQEQLAAAKAEVQPKIDAIGPIREAAVAAETARVAAAQAAEDATRELEPVSVFISRKTQRLYVRQGFQPLLESPVTIQDPDRPIGTHVFTAMERTNEDTKTLWSVVSLDGRRPEGGPVNATDLSGAKAALDRIVIPQDTLERIAATASPRSSLIISDEALSSETGKDTEFVVLLSGEPQGGVKFRRRSPETEVRYDMLRERQRYWRSPSPYSTW
jgi:lipoprotein-anchoring transpeptidase ErfK/SrfK